MVNDTLIKLTGDITGYPPIPFDQLLNVNFVSVPPAPLSLNSMNPSEIGVACAKEINAIRPTAIRTNRPLTIHASEVPVLMVWNGVTFATAYDPKHSDRTGYC